VSCTNDFSSVTGACGGAAHLLAPRPGSCGEERRGVGVARAGVVHRHAPRSGNGGEVERGKRPATSLFEFPDSLTDGTSVLGVRPPYCLRVAAPGSDGSMLFARKAANWGFNGPDCGVSRKKVFRASGEVWLVTNFEHGLCKVSRNIAFFAVAGS